ncbi:MAG: CHAT domain-containing protein [Phormidesmis sp.]
MLAQVPAILLSTLGLLVMVPGEVTAQTHISQNGFEATAHTAQDVALSLELSQENSYLKQSGSRADQLHEEGKQAYRAGRLRESIDLYQQALNLYRRANNPLMESVVLSNMGFAYANLAEYQQALDYSVQALSAAQLANDPNLESLALYSLGSSYRALGEDQSAIEMYARSLAIAENISHNRRIALVSAALGESYRELSRLAEAEAAFQKSAEAARREGDLCVESRALSRIAALYSSQGNTSAAFDLYQRGLRLSRDADDCREEGTILFNMAGLLLTNGYTDQAFTYYSQSLELSEEAQNWERVVRTRAILRTMQGGSRGLAQTIQDLESILAAARQNGDVPSEIWALTRLGDEYASVEQYDRALPFYEQSLALAQSSGNSASVGNLFATLGSLMEKQGQSSPAIAFYKKSVNITQSTRQTIQNLPIDIQQTYVSLSSFAYRQLIDLLLEQGRVLEAQQVLELLKVQELREYTDDERTDAALSELTLLPQEQAIINEFNTLVSFGQRLRDCEASRCNDLSNLRNTRDEQFRQYKAAIDSLQNFIAERLKEGDTIDLILNPTDFETKAQEIIAQQPGTVIIYPLVLEDRLWLLWAAEGRIISRREIDVNRVAVGEKVIQFRELLEDRYSDPEEIKAVGKQLYDWLILPVEDELAANQDIEHLVFSLDRTTRYIPMGALHDGEQFLIEKYTIATILSAALTNVSSRSPVGTEGVSVLGAGVSQGFEDFRALSYVPVELDGIIREAGDPTDTDGIYSGQQLLDPDFTFESLRDALEEKQFLHIATHGSFVPGDQDESYLLMGGGKKLLVSEIETLKSYMEDLHMVVLSACQTALGGPDEEGLEVAGLGYYFLRSQVAAVMASLWNVSDSSTSQFMQTFYQILASGTAEEPMTKAEALQRAQIAMLHSGAPGVEGDDRFTYVPQDDDAPLPESGLAHPYYWAPFTLIGNGL